MGKPVRIMNELTVANAATLAQVASAQAAIISKLASVETTLATFLIGSTTGNAGQPVRVGGSAKHSQEWELGHSSVHLLRYVPTASCETVIRTYFYRKA